MESTYISYSKAKISPINSTFLRSKSWSFIDDCSIWQSHEWNSSFNNPFNNYIRRVPRLLPSSTWIDINGWIKLRVWQSSWFHQNLSGELIGGNEYLENRYRTGSETGNGSGQVWGHVGLRSSQGKLCAGKPFWIYRTTQSMARYSRHAAIRHAPKYWWIPTILDYSWNFNISLPLLPPKLSSLNFDLHARENSKFLQN